MHVWCAQVWISCPETAGIIRQKILSIGDWHLKGREVQRHTSGSQLAENLIVVRCYATQGRRISRLDQPRISVPRSQEVSEGSDAVVQEAHRITSANRALSLITKQDVE